VNAVEITPEALAQLSSEEKRELLLILETLETPKLARIKSDAAHDPGQTYSRELAEVLTAARKRREAQTPKNWRRKMLKTP